jgi:hypothetical protein
METPTVLMVCQVVLGGSSWQSDVVVSSVRASIASRPHHHCRRGPHQSGPRVPVRAAMVNCLPSCVDEVLERVG